MKHRINRRTLEISIYMLYSMYFIYRTYSIYTSKPGKDRAMQSTFNTLLYIIISIIFYSIFIYNTHLKKKTYKNYNFNEKIILYSLISLILWCILSILLFTTPIHILKSKDEIKKLRKEYKEK